MTHEPIKDLNIKYWNEIISELYLGESLESLKYLDFTYVSGFEIIFDTYTTLFDNYDEFMNHVDIITKSEFLSRKVKSYTVRFKKGRLRKEASRITNSFLSVQYLPE